jgi:hypothetical protein
MDLRKWPRSLLTGAVCLCYQYGYCDVHNMHSEATPRRVRLAGATIAMLTSRDVGGQALIDQLVISPTEGSDMNGYGLRKQEGQL